MESVDLLGLTKLSVNSGPSLRRSVIGLLSYTQIFARNPSSFARESSSLFVAPFLKNANTNKDSSTPITRPLPDINSFVHSSLGSQRVTLGV